MTADRIEVGVTVVLQRYNYMRTHVLNPAKPLQLGRDNVSLSGVVGHRYGTIFQMVPDPANKKVFQLEVAKEVVDFEGLFLTGEGGADNRDLVDGDGSQNLSREAIEEMRETGASGVHIVSKLIENSETYQNKTKFSQEKFLKKKAKKYHQYVVIRKPSIRLLMEIMYKNPMAILNLRIDSLAQILNMSNVHSGGRYLVYETGAQGIVVAAMLERLGGSGELIHIYQTGQPQTTAINSLGLHKSEILSLLNIQHLRSQEQGVNILAHHPPRNGEPQSKRLKSDDTDTQADPPADEMKDIKKEEEAMDHLENDAHEEMKHLVVKKEANVPENGRMDAQMPLRMTLRERSVAAYQSLVSKPVDGLVIVCKQHPANLLSYLAKFVAPSRPFVVFSPYKEPLLETYMRVKEEGLAVMVALSESWLRNHQVLPQRTHPTVLMSGGGGYLLTGTFVAK